MIPGRIGDLIEKYFEATLSKSETRELEQWLLEDETNIDYFIRHVDVHVGLHQTLAEMPERASNEDAWGSAVKGASEDAWGSSTRDAGEDTWGSAEARKPSGAWGRRRVWPLAAAAALLVAIGLSIFLRSGQTGADSFAVAQVVQCNGAVVREPAGGGRFPLQASDRLGRGDRLITRAGGRVTIRTYDKSEIDLDEQTELGMAAGQGRPEMLRLHSGRIYCAVTPRDAGAEAFAVGLNNGGRAVALGTRFELAALPGKSPALTVEHGKVRLESPASAPREAGALQTLTLDSAGRIAGPEDIPLYSVAAWKFRPDAVPDGDILFQSAFDTPESINALIGSAGLAFAATSGVNRSGCLAMQIKPAERVTFFPKLDLRQKQFEISCDLMFGHADDEFRFCPLAELPAQPGRFVEWCNLMGSQDLLPVGQWMHIRSVFRGDTMSETWSVDGKIVHQAAGHVSDDPVSYSRISLGAYVEAACRQPVDFRVDNLTIRKIAAAPYEKVVFHYSFDSGSLEKWKIFQGNWSVASGQGFSGGNCLQLDWKPGEMAAIYANVDLQNRDFEMRFRTRTPTTVGYAPILSVATTNLGEVIDVEDAGGGFPPGAMIPNNEWCAHRFVVKGDDLRHTVTYKGKIVYDRKARIKDARPFVLPGLLFSRTKAACRALVDDVLITQTDE